VVKDEKGGVDAGGDKSKCLQKRGEAKEPGSGGLFEPIKGLVEPAHKMRVCGVNSTPFLQARRGGTRF
jgi:hypothetical protein